MNRVKKWTSITAALFLMVVSILIVGFNLKPINANAQIRNFTVEEYTNDDRLLKSDGQLSVRTIRNFANDVNAGYSGQEFPELAQVVPLEYLESTENTATFAYNGKEYGFYMAKEGEHFDLLLIDFVYEFDDADHTNNEYKIGQTDFANGLQPVFHGGRLCLGKNRPYLYILCRKSAVPFGRTK